jgi:hypothetical protein
VCGGVRACACESARARVCGCESGVQLGARACARAWLTVWEGGRCRNETEASGSPTGGCCGGGFGRARSGGDSAVCREAVAISVERSVRLEASDRGACAGLGEMWIVDWREASGV